MNRQPRLWILTAVLLLRCQPEQLRKGDIDRTAFSSLAPFDSEASLKAWSDGMPKAVRAGCEPIVLATPLETSSCFPPPQSVSPPAVLVTTFGSRAVVLDDTRIRVTEGAADGGATLSELDSAPPALSLHPVWFALWVDGQRAIALGKAYVDKITTWLLATFTIDASSQLHPEATHFVYLDDVMATSAGWEYSAGSLIAYAQIPAQQEGWSPSSPSTADWRSDSSLSSWTRVLPAERILRPIQGLSLALHVILRCTVAGAALSCAADAVVAPYSSHLHRTADDVFVWAPPMVSTSEATTDAPSAVYRLPLSGGPATAMLTRGVPTSTEAFRVRDGALQVVVMDNHGGASEVFGPRGAALATLPLDRFSSAPTQPEASQYAPLSGDSCAYRTVADAE